VAGGWMSCSRKMAGPSMLVSVSGLVAGTVHEPVHRPDVAAVISLGASCVAACCGLRVDARCVCDGVRLIAFSWFYGLPYQMGLSLRVIRKGVRHCGVIMSPRHGHWGQRWRRAAGWDARIGRSGFWADLYLSHGHCRPSARTSPLAAPCDG